LGTAWSFCVCNTSIFRRFNELYKKFPKWMSFWCN
jgi:hypothetical protein